MIEVGKLCVKTCGRDAGKMCVIVEILDKNLVLIDGATRRRKCNIAHIEPLKTSLDIKKGASHEEVAKALKEMGIEARSTKPKKKTERPRRTRKEKIKEVKPEVKEVPKPAKKKTVKKAASKTQSQKAKE